MLSWIPLLGPIFQGISQIVGKFTDLASVKLTTTSQQEIAATQAATQIIQTTNDDILLRILRDLIIAPIAVWSFLLSWDTIIAENTWVSHDWMWHLASFDKTGAPYLPYVVLVFLFGNIGLNIWRNKL